MKQNKTLFITVFLVGIFTAISAIPPVTQPIGTLARTYNTAGALPFPVQPPAPLNPFPAPATPVEEVNYICAQWDSSVSPATSPFDNNYPVTEVILTVPQHFVRLLGTPTSSSNGAWIMRSEYVRGKTPAQLRDIFALPNQPIEICNVEMPASPDPVTGKDYALWTGITGPILGDGHNWGNGGTVQNRLVADFGTHYFPNYRYTSPDTRNHRQPIGDYALSYRPLAGSGNTYSIASYLDTYVPQAYSDLENVYTSLDYLNYVDYGPCPLRNALAQLSPEKYDALSFLAMRNTILFSDSILEWQIFRQWEHRWFCCSRESSCHESEPYIWLQGVGEFNTNVPTGFCNNFCYKSGGLIAGIDWHIRPHVVMGLCAAGLGTTLSWCADHAHARSGNANLGFYTSYVRKYFFIDGMISAGGTWGSACRRIVFNDVNRIARSHPTDEDVALSVQSGLTFVQGIVPYARLTYIFNRQNCFTECGADSLNLMVAPYNTHTLRANLGLEMNYVFENPRVKIMPQVQLAWVDDFFLKAHILKARICGPQGSFAVCGMREFGSCFLGGAGINFMWRDCYALLVRYEAQVKSNYVIHDAKVGVQISF